MTCRDIAAAQALTVAERLLDPDAVLAAVASTSAAASLASGLPGTALLHARLAAVEPASADAAVRHWTTAVRHASSRGGSGVYGTPGGLAASLIIAAPYLPDPGLCHTAAARAARWLSARAQHAAARLLAGAPPSSWACYDTINGLAGIGRVLLAAHTAGHAKAEPGLHAALTALTTMINRDGQQPGWWLPATSRHPTGEANTGMAHGIAGPLAIAHTTGHTVNGQPRAIRRAAAWLQEWQIDGTWPPTVTGSGRPGDEFTAAPGRRDAWCYGSPGIASALIHAGHALADSYLLATGRRCMERHAARPPQQWDVEGPTLCHGYAGVLQAAVAAPLADRAAAGVVAFYDPATAFGFQHQDGQKPTDNAGLLTGAAGIALALADHAHIPAPDVHTRWDALLLLS